MQNLNHAPQGPAAYAPPKRGLSKGLKIVLILLLVFAVGFIGLAVLGVGR